MVVLLVLSVARLKCTRLADLEASGSFHFDARMELELSMRLHGKTIEFDNAGYLIPVRHEHYDS